MKTLVWLGAGGCGGCSMSLLTAEAPDCLTALELAGIELLWHPSLSALGGAQLLAMLDAMEAGAQTLDILCVEGALLTAFAGTVAPRPPSLFAGDWREEINTALHDWLQQPLRPMFANRVQPVSEDVMFKWRLLAEAGGWAQGRAHLPAARPDHCGDGAAPWAHGRHL